MPIYPDNRFVPARQLDDSDRNILRELQHEPCEWHCEGCDCCDEGQNAYLIDGAPFCDDCYEAEYADWLERRDEARREGKLNRG